MENKDNTAISRLYKSLKSREEVRALIPMGYVAGMPIIAIKNEQLVAQVPFLRYKITGEVDRTLVFPIRYIMEYLVPEGHAVGFKDLAMEPEYADYNFDQVIGFFRHQAVKHLDREAFMKLKEQILAQYDKLVSFLIGESEDYTPTDDQTLASNLQTIIEPFVIKQYASLNNDFYNKYLTNQDGKN